MTCNCPKCGAPHSYIGATNAECGYYPKCSNYTKRQAVEVQKLFDETAEKFEDEQISLWDDDTEPYLPIPLFSTD